MPSISFIIPTFNGLPLLKRCLNSIEKQINDSDSVIIINDGSNDGTKEFLNDHYTDKPNFVVINQKNLGSGPARNAGLLYSNSEYIWFVDSDDYIIDNAVELIKKELSAKNYDVLFMGYIRKIGKKQKEYKIGIDPNNTEEILLTQHYPWNKVIKKSLFKGIEFPNENIRYQDLATIPRILLKANSIGKLNKSLYYYDFSHLQNITKNIKKEKDIFKACDYLVGNFKEKNYNELELILLHIFVFNRIYFSPEKTIKSIYKQISEIKDYLNKNIPQWGQSRYLQLSFASRTKGIIPYLKIKILLGKVFKLSTHIMTLVIFTLLKIKPLTKQE